MTTTTTKTAGAFKALMARVATINTGSPALPIQYPNQTETFTPPTSGKYLKAALFPNAPAWTGLRGGRKDQGILLVTVVWPKNQGEVAPLEMAGVVLDHFEVGLSLSSDQASVKIEAGGFVGAPINEPDSVQVPVTVRWAA